MASFFKHENQHYLPSLSDFGKQWFAKKSDLLHILAQESQQDPPTYFDAIAYDSAALVHLLPTTQISTFDEYATDIFLSHILQQLKTCNRVDIIRDKCIRGSIKAVPRKLEGVLA